MKSPADTKLDHVGVAVRDLDAGRAAYERLGFQLTVRSHHRGSPSPGAPVEPWGSGNHCAMFRDGYLEIVGLTDPAMFSSVKTLLARYQGAHIVALGCESADATRTELERRGIKVDAPRQLERDAAYGTAGTETRRAAFRNMYLDRATYPEALFFYIQHMTRDVLWQPHLLAHPNGVTGIRDAFLCVAEPQATAEKLAPALGCAPERIDKGEWRLPLNRSSIRVMAPAAWARWAPDTPPPPLPGVAGIGFRVESIAATRGLLAARGVSARDGREGGIWVDPARGCGAALYFFAGEDQ